MSKETFRKQLQVQIFSRTSSANLHQGCQNAFPRKHSEKTSFRKYFQTRMETERKRLAALSKVHSRSPEEHFGMKLYEIIYKFRKNFFRHRVESFWQVCQNCILRYQRNILEGTFSKRVKN